jgi:poly[(R)-3-hydroxyalkanoate] polymerase subunit PhaC
MASSATLWARSAAAFLAARLIAPPTATAYLDGADTAAASTPCCAMWLIFNYPASNRLMGDQPPAFDLLALERRRHAPAGRDVHLLSAVVLPREPLENQLAAGTTELAGRRLDLAAVNSDTYISAAQRDHIVLWFSSYKST